MSEILTRRSLLAGAGYVAAGTTLASRILSIAEAEEAAPSGAPQGQAGAPMLCMTMVFPNVAKSKFNQDRYVSKHLPLLRKVYGDSVARIELRMAQASPPGLPPASVTATEHVWIANVPAFAKALAGSAKDINEDLDATAQGPRISQVDRVIASAGGPLADVKESSLVFTTFYRVTEGKNLDLDYFRTAHIPKLFAMYGASATRRIEGLQGQDQGTAKATFLATTHIYSRDRGAFDDGVKQNLNDTIDDIKKYTNIAPEFNEFRVQAIG